MQSREGTLAWHLLQEVALPAALGVPDGGGVGGLGDEEVGPALVDPGRAQVAVGRHVVVTRVHQALGEEDQIKVHYCMDIYIL